VSFYDDPNDEEMLHLKFYLDCLRDCDDVRDKNRDAFQLAQLAEAQMQKLMNGLEKSSPTNAYDDSFEEPT